MKMTDDRDSLPELSFDGPSQETGRAIREAVAADLDKVAPRTLRTRTLHALVVAAIVGALTIASFGPGALAHVLDDPPTLFVGALITIATVLIATSAFAPRLKPLGRDTRGLVVAVGIAAWSLYLVSTVSEVDWSSIGTASGCAVRSLGAGIVGAAAFMWVWRKTDPWTPRLSGALIGVCAGIVASAHVGIVCAGAHGGHVLIGHWLVVPVLAACGFAFSRRVLAP